MYDIIVVGAGLTGAFAARTLAARGRSVLVLDARELGHTAGSSHGTSRIFRSAHADPLYADLARRALPLWKELEAESGVPILTITGGVDYGRDRGVRALHDAVVANGVECELLAPEAAAERFPGMRFPTEVLFHPAAGHIDPEATIRAALALAQRDGAEVILGRCVGAVREANGHVVVTTADGDYTARHCILAAGPWLPGMIAESLPDLPTPDLTVTEQTVTHFAQTDPDANWPVFVCKHDNQFFGLPSGAETGAEPTIKIGRHDAGPVVTADSRGGVPDSVSVDLIRAFAREWIPGLDTTPFQSASCLYTRTHNEDFLIHRAGPITVASPCSGQGAKFAPSLGELISDIALEVRQTPDRFALAAHS